MTSKTQETSREGRESLEMESRDSAPVLPTTNPATISTPPKIALHASIYVIAWIALSSSVILFQKWLLYTRKFEFPIFLTTWHMLFATIATQILARTTHLLDGRKTVKMTGKVYIRAILPIGLFFSLSLVFGNQAYMYLSVSFIQMLKATTPVAVLLVGYLMRTQTPNLRIIGNVSVIVIGVIIASYGEIKFELNGFIFQVLGLTFEATRLVLVERLLSSAEYKMDPLVSLYYFAPICTGLNFVMWVIFESTRMSTSAVADIGLFVLLANASVAFALNVSVVFLIGKTSSLVLTLCGVLKDILLVAASVIFYGDPVSALQMFGYSISLAGMVYYKLGAQKIREHYTQLRTNGGHVWSELGNKHPAWRKTGVAGGAIFLILVLGGLYSSSTGAEKATLGSAAMGDMAIAPAVNTGLMEVPVTTLDTHYKPPRKLDVVISMFKKDPAVVGEKLKALKSSKAFKGLNVNVIIYLKDNTADISSIKKSTGASKVTKLKNVGREGGTYLHHIVDQWDSLAQHTLFLQDDFHNFAKILARLDDYFVPDTGMLSLGFGHAACSCERCHDPWTSTDVWTRVPEIYSAVYEELCPPSKILLSYAGQFIVSARRIRGTEKRVYQHLKDVLESDSDHWIHGDPRSSKFTDTPSNPYFGHVMERSWMITFKCANPILARTCPKLEQRRQKGDPDDKCQCLDTGLSSKAA